MNLDSSIFLTVNRSTFSIQMTIWRSHCVRNKLEQHLRSVCLTLILRTAIPSPPFMMRMWGVSWVLRNILLVSSWNVGKWSQRLPSRPQSARRRQLGQHSRVDFVLGNIQIFVLITSSRQRQHVSNELRHCTRRKIFLKNICSSEVVIILLNKITSHIQVPTIALVCYLILVPLA